TSGVIRNPGLGELDRGGAVKRGAGHVGDGAVGLRRLRIIRPALLGAVVLKIDRAETGGCGDQEGNKGDEKLLFHAWGWGWGLPPTKAKGGSFGARSDLTGSTSRRLSYVHTIPRAQRAGSRPRAGRSAPAEKLGRGGGARLHVQLLIDMLHVGADGADADVELVADLLVQAAPGEKSEDLLLARGELFHVGGGPLELMEITDHLARDLHRHRRATGVDLLDRLDQLGITGFFQQI